MNINMMDLILLCSTVIFAMIAAGLLLHKILQRKNIIKALQNSQMALKAQLSSNESTLKNAFEPMLTPELSKKISELIAVERDSYRNLITLFVDYHPAAIEMMPFLMNQVISSYIQCFQHVALKNPVQATAEQPAEDLSDAFQYEALIEQLRYEKQDFANKYKDAYKLLKAICHNYKEQLKLNTDDSLEQMNLIDIAKLLNLEFTPTKTDPT